ncbi:Hypothetical protein ETEE_1166 [Edwardsiella anguillarum ET080813]|uniref:Uncharacterized protein n=1 Tax=Edwardsiella anguillarum ET080813 TaxID=667120 RepID=A0A076LLQ9_9GAMM|nr:Hypothetical protein ETEE_1166 [Edwardsiella anguillarum ET080813]
MTVARFFLHGFRAPDRWRTRFSRGVSAFYEHFMYEIF